MKSRMVWLLVGLVVGVSLAGTADSSLLDTKLAGLEVLIGSWEATLHQEDGSVATVLFSLTPTAGGHTAVGDIEVSAAGAIVSSTHLVYYWDSGQEQLMQMHFGQDEHIQFSVHISGNSITWQGMGQTAGMPTVRLSQGHVSGDVFVWTPLTTSTGGVTQAPPHPFTTPLIFHRTSG